MAVREIFTLSHFEEEDKERESRVLIHYDRRFDIFSFCSF